MTDKEWIDRKIDESEKCGNTLTAFLLGCVDDELGIGGMPVDILKDIAFCPYDYIRGKYEHPVVAYCYSENFDEISRRYSLMLSRAAANGHREVFFDWDTRCGGCNEANENHILRAVIEDICKELIDEYGNTMGRSANGY